MNLVQSWKLTAAIFALALVAAFAVWPGAMPRGAEATVSNIDTNVTVGEDGQVIEVTIDGTADSGDLDVTTDSDETFVLDDCTTATPADCSTAETASGATYTLDTDDAAVDDDYTLVLDMTLNCSSPEEITITADDDDNSDSVVVYCVPDLSDEQVQIEKQADDNDSYTFDWDADDGDCLVIADDGTIDFGGGGLFDLEDNEEAEFYCENSVELSIDEIDDGDFVAIDDCDNDDGVIITGSRADFDIDDLDATAFCTWINDDDFQVIPTPVAGAPAKVTITLTATRIQCGSGTLIQVTPRSASNGPVAAGTTLTVSSSLGGTFQPASSITSSFPVTLANFLYTAPANVSGNTTITARAGNVQTTAVIEIVCAETPPPTATPAPLEPPSAGDGGLLNSSSGGGYLPYTVAAVAIAAVAVAGLATRRFAFGTAGIERGAPQLTFEQSNPGGFALLVSLILVAVALLTRNR